MRPNRMLMMLGGCLLAGSAACADELGFVDCASHNDTTPVFAKARKSQDIVANVPCGERFKVLVYGFVFSEIQTSDGKVGFIYSNVMTADRSGGALQSRAGSATTPALSSAAEKTKIYAEPKQTAEPVRTQAAAAPATNLNAAPAAASENAAVTDSGVRGAVIDGQVPAAQPRAAPAPATLPGAESVLKATSTSATSAEAPVVQSNAASAATPATAAQPAAVEATPAPVTAAPAPAPASAPAPAPETSPAEPAKAAETPAAAPNPVAQPEPAAEAQPQPAEVQPAVTPSVKKERWEKPNAGARTASLLELFGGFAFSRMSNGSGYPGTNFMGGMGSFGVNLKPWLQIVGDTSYSFENATGVKNVIYGNHYGPRFFLRGRSKWAISPFGEVLVGGSRADTTITGPGGYTVSQNCFSIKAGGGLDIKPSRMFEVRLIDVDYYRTSFGTNLHQSNYWVSTGVVIRLMKPWWE